MRPETHPTAPRVSDLRLSNNNREAVERMSRYTTLQERDDGYAVLFIVGRREIVIDNAGMKSQEEADFVRTMFALALAEVVAREAKRKSPESSLPIRG